MRVAATCHRGTFGDATPATFRLRPLTKSRPPPQFVPMRDLLDQAHEEEGILASTDPWFPSVNVTTGPDVLFMSWTLTANGVEHPDFVPEAMRKNFIGVEV